MTTWKHSLVFEFKHSNGMVGALIGSTVLGISKIKAFLMCKSEFGDLLVVVDGFDLYYFP